jgi:lipopolysaccharide/colanic/teichoic acid biosynthesis glycosyltransferase
MVSHSTVGALASISAEEAEEKDGRAGLAPKARPGADLPGPQPSAYFGWHGLLNRVAACLMLVAAAPVILLTVLLVKLTSRGPAIYRQTRVGKHRRTFVLYKIRTMVADAEARSGAVWTTSPKDYRITPVGKVLRITHLDELPQLWNVIRGDMALVGPRPERPEFTKVLADSIPGYFDRLAVLPGITGYAQINLPPDSDLSSVKRKLVLDLEYVRNGSLLLDLRIIFCTLFRVLGLPSAAARRLLGVYYSLQRLTEELETVIDKTIPDLNAWSGSACADAGRQSAG